MMKLRYRFAGGFFNKAAPAKLLSSRPESGARIARRGWRELNISPYVCRRFLLKPCTAMKLDPFPGEGTPLSGKDDRTHMHTTNAFRLPKAIESDPRAPQLLHALATHSRLLWQGGTLNVPEGQLSDALREVLLSVHHAGQVVRGLEKAEQKLATEARGQGLADRKSGVTRGVRISRLLILTSDGAERFYRQVESLLRRHGPRVIAVRLAMDAEGLGEMLYGPGRLARLLLIEHKAAVGATLLTLADQWADAAGGV